MSTRVEEFHCVPPFRPFPTRLLFLLLLGGTNSVICTTKLLLQHAIEYNNCIVQIKVKSDLNWHDLLLLSL